MFILLLVILVFLLVIPQINKGFAEKIGITDCCGLSYWAIIVVITISAILILGSIVYVVSIDEIAKLESFYWEVKDCYEYTIDESEAITIHIPQLINENSETINLNALAYWGLAGNISERIKELRDETKEYNYSLKSHRKYNSLFITDQFVANVPDYLLPINLKLENE